MSTVDNVLGFDHLHIYCTDTSTTARFFTDHFGGKLTGESDNIHGQARLFIDLAGILLALSPFPPGTHAPPPATSVEGGTGSGGIAHFGIRVRAVTAAVEALEAAGVVILTRPTSDSLLAYAYISAPDGVVIELTEY